MDTTTITVVSNKVTWSGPDKKNPEMTRFIWKLECADGKERYTWDKMIKDPGEHTVKERVKKGQPKSDGSGHWPDQTFADEPSQGGWKGGGKKEWKESDRDRFYVAVSCLLSANEVTCRLIEKEKIKDSKGAMSTITMLAHHNLQVLLGLREACTESNSAVPE